MPSEDPVVSPVNALALSEEAFFFERSLDLLSVLGLDGYFKRINPAFTQTLGYSEAEMLSSPFLDFVHPDDHSATLAEMEKLNLGVPTLYFENRYLTKDGNYRWLAWTASPQVNQGVVYCVARDMTQQKEAEAAQQGLESALHRANQELEQRVAERTKQLEQAYTALRESEERNQLAMEVAHIFSFEWEPSTDVVKRSPHCASILRLTEAEAERDTGATFFQRIHPDDRDRFIANLKTLTPEHPIYTINYRVVCPNGDVVDLEESGRALFDTQDQLVRLIGMTADVTERRRLEAEVEASRITLQRQLAEIETIYQSAPIGLNVLDTDLRFVRINQRLAEINGFAAEDHIGRTVRELLPNLADAAEAVLRPILETGEPLLNVEIQGETPAQPGIQRVWLESFLPLKDGERVIGINTVCQEITERKQTEAALRQNVARLEFVLDVAQFGTWEVNLQSQPYVANPRSLKHDQIYGYDTLQPEWTYDIFLAHIHPDDRSYVATEFQKTLTTHANWTLECRIIRADGVLRWVWISGSVYRDTDDQPLWLMGLIADITDRKQAAQRLQESKERLSLGMQVAGFALVRVDYAIDQVELSPEAATLYGLPPDQLVISRETFHDTFHPDERDGLMRSIETIMDPAGPGWFARDHRVVWRNGEVKWLTVRKQVFFDRSGDLAKPSHAIMVALDITDRKAAEAALLRSEERYRTLFETMEDGFCVIEVLFEDQNTPIDYRFLEVNPAFARQTGLQDAVGKTARQLRPNLEEFWFETYGRVALTGEPIRFENGSDAMQRWFEVYTFRIGEPAERKVAILFREISDRKQAELALRDNEDRLKMAITSAQLGTWDWNILTGELKWDNGCKALFGLAPEADISMDLFVASIHPDDREPVQRIIQAALDSSSGGAFDAEYRVMGVQDGVERWLLSKGQTYYDADGQPWRFSGTVLDITEQKQVAAQRETLLQQEQAAREAAEFANRMKDEFLAVLSHELRTPLNPILGWAKLLQSPNVKPEKLQLGLTTIERNAKQQVQMIDDLLDISRIIRGKIALNFSVFPLAEPILAALETVRLAAEAKTMQLEVLLDPFVEPIRGDAGRLQQVVWNLLSNAIKFTPAGGKVTVQLDQMVSPVSSLASPAPFAALSYAQITISDTGKGIQPDFLPYVFDLFRQQDSSTTRSFGGLGLGLAIARQVVEAHGGSITAKSAGEGHGSTFTVLLPLLPAPSSDLPTDKSDRSLNLNQRRIVVVDDEPDSVQLVKVMLDQGGAIVRAASSALEALQILKEEPFDLLISDIGMPGVDGYAFIRQVRALPAQQNSAIPAIALTAYVGEANQRKILASGYQAHVAKPIEPEDLLTAIATVISS